MTNSQEYKNLSRQLTLAIDSKNRVFDVMDLVNQLIDHWHLLPEHSIYKTRKDLNRLIQLKTDLENRIN